MHSRMSNITKKGNAHSKRSPIVPVRFFIMVSSCADGDMMQKVWWPQTVVIGFLWRTIEAELDLSAANYLNGRYFSNG